MREPSRRCLRDALDPARCEDYWDHRGGNFHAKPAGVFASTGRAEAGDMEKGRSSHTNRHDGDTDGHRRAEPELRSSASTRGSAAAAVGRQRRWKTRRQDVAIDGGGSSTSCLPGACSRQGQDRNGKERLATEDGDSKRRQQRQSCESRCERPEPAPTQRLDSFLHEADANTFGKHCKGATCFLMEGSSCPCSGSQGPHDLQRIQRQPPQQQQWPAVDYPMHERSRQVARH